MTFELPYEQKAALVLDHNAKFESGLSITVSENKNGQKFCLKSGPL